MEMTPTSMLVVLLLVFVSCGGLQEAEGGMSSQCTYLGYKPGSVIKAISGNIKEQKPAQLETTVLQTTLDYFNGGSEVTVAALELVAVASKVMKAAPQLAATINMVTAALGFLDKTPSPQDILDKAMESVNILTKEVNVMIDQMKDYVDAKDLEVQKNNMKNIYKELFQYWINCAKELTPANVNDCQRQAERNIQSARFHFQPLHEKFEQKTKKGKLVYNPKFSYRKSAGTWQWMDKNCGLQKHARAKCLSHEGVKHLEVGIIPFRDYATLHLLALKTVEATYEKNSKTDKLACGYYKKYLTERRDKADVYAGYARWAYEWDYIRQYEENDYLGVDGRPNPRGSAFRGGFLGTRKCSGDRKCSMECTQMIADKKCTVTGRGAGDAVFKACENYNQETKKQLTAFWENNIMGVVTVWEKYRDDAAAKLSKVTCDAGSYGKRRLYNYLW